MLERCGTSVEMFAEAKKQTTIIGYERVVTLIIAAAFLTASTLAAAEPIVVKPGSDLFAAIQRARTLPKPVVIELAAGRHELNEIVALDSRDDGLTLRGAGATIAGSRRVVGWMLINAEKNVWEAAFPPESSKFSPSDVFLNNSRLQIARTPNEGWFETDEIIPISDPFPLSISQIELQPRWVSDGHIYVVGLQKWTGFKLPIRGVDAEKKSVLLHGKLADYRQERTNRFWLENAPEFLDASGEWIADRKVGMLRLIPPKDSGSPNDAKISVAVFPALLRLNGCTDVAIRDLRFTECGDDFPFDSGEVSTQAAAERRGAIQLQSCRRILLERCRIDLVGGYAIDIGRGSRECTIRQCEVRQLGAGGVRIGEQGIDPDPENEVRDNVVEDTLIANYGEQYPGAVGVIVFQSRENAIRYNDIGPGRYTGVSCGWTWGYMENPCKGNVVEFNHIHDLGLDHWMSDLGGVYMLGSQPGAIVRGNWIHDIKCHEYGGWGLYTDEGATGVILERNIVARCNRAGFHQHYGRDNVVRHNLFVDCGEGTVRRTRQEDHLSFRFERNIVVNPDNRFLHGGFDKSGVQFDKNIYDAPEVERGTWSGLTWNKWRESGQDRESVIADPLLVDTKRPELGVMTDGPASRLGIPPFPNPNEIGVRKKESP